MANVPDEMAVLQVLRAACCIAAQDGRISGPERSIINELAEKAGVGAASLNAMVEQAEEDPDFSREQFKIIQTDPLPTMKALARVAAADGVVSTTQEELLTRFGARLGIEGKRLHVVLDRVDADPSGAG